MTFQLSSSIYLIQAVANTFIHVLESAAAVVFHRTSFAAVSMTSLPVISLKEYDTPERLAAPLRKACTQSGFFYLTDTGTDDLVKAAFGIAQDYFLKSTDEEKSRYPYSMETGLVSRCFVDVGYPPIELDW